MRTIFKTILACACLFLGLHSFFFNDVRAQLLPESSPLSVKLDVLGHGEIRKGGIKDSSNYDPRFLVSRERLLVDYTGSSEKLRWDLSLTLQHLAIWGQQGSLRVFEGWGKLSNNWGAFVQVGRQALSYDDERIIGMNDWAMAAQSHDALRTGFEHGAHKFHLIAAYNQDNDVEETGGSYYSDGGAQCYKTMLMGWYHLQPSNFPASLSLLFMNVGMQSGTKGVNEYNEYQQLFGGYAKFDKPWLTLEGSYYRQCGHEEHGLPIEAWMAAAKATWRPLKWFDVIAGYDYLSGDEEFAVPASGTIGLMQHKVVKGFNSIWGSHHKFYGAMDFFYLSAFYGGFTPGLQNLYATTAFHPLPGLDCSIGYHYFATATKLKEMDYTLGHELEFEASYAFSKVVSLSVGFSYMDGTETMERLKRTAEGNSLTWGWIDLRFKL